MSTISVEQFLKQLADSGLMSAEDIKAFQASIPADKKKDAQELARELIRQKKLTKFQAEAVYQGKTKSLVLGNYVILDKIGQGGMGQVFKAQHRRMKRVVALKVLSPAVVKNPTSLQRFQREVEAAAKLTHPNIVTAHDADEANGVHFLVMEYVEASDLASLVKKQGPLPIGTAVNCILQAAKGLEYAHKKGVVHRDIKPHNLLLDPEGVVKVLDMGLARVEDGPGAKETPGGGLTESGQMLGTVDFMPPEQALNTRFADHRADIYSLGCSLYYLLGGKALYPGETMMEKLLAHREQPIPSLRDVQPDVPDALDAVFKKMVAKDPKDRYQSMSEVIAALQGCGVASEAPTLTSQGEAVSTSRVSKKGGGVAIQKVTTAPGEETGVGQAAENTADVQVATRTMPGSGSNGKKWLIVAGALSVAGLLAVAVVAVILALPRQGPKRPTVQPTGDNRGEVDLLAQIDPKRDAVKGEWRFEGKTLVTPKDEHALIQIPFPPPEEYELEVVAAWIEGDSRHFGIGLTRGASQFMVALDGWSDEHIAGLEMLDGKLFQDNETKYKWPIFQKAKPTLIVCRVLRNKVVIICDGHTVIHWKGDFSRFSLPERWKVPAEKALFLGSWKNTFDISRIVLRRLPDSEKEFNDWLVSVEKMSATKKVEAVAAKLKELNPGFAGKLTPNIERGVVTELQLSPSDYLGDISPLRAIPTLKNLACEGGECSNVMLHDLSPLSEMKLTDLRIGCGPRGGIITPLRGMPLKRLEFHEIPNVTDLSALQGMPLTSLKLCGSQIHDLTPLKGMRLTSLELTNSHQIAALTPLQGMPLTFLHLGGCSRVRDLTPLKGMPLTNLNLAWGDIPASDLTPLKGMPLTKLKIQGCPHVTDLTPLEGMQLTEIWLIPKNITKGMDVLRAMKSLNLGPGRTSIGVPKDGNTWGASFSAEEFWKKYDAGEFNKPDARQAAFDAWCKDVATMPAEEQVKAVAKLLKSRNPGFEGHIRRKGIEKGVVTGLALGDVTDISPLRGCPDLTMLDIHGNRGLSDLSPLKGLKLKVLLCSNSKVSNLSPLEGMPLTSLSFNDTQVADLSPLMNIRLVRLECQFTKVTDLTPLQGMPLEDIRFTPRNITKGMNVLRQMKSLKTIGIEWDDKNKWTAEEFWKKYDAGEFK